MNAVTDQPERHLTATELAERLGVPLATIYQWRSRRTGPKGFACGRYIRYRLGDVTDWEEAQIRKSNS